MRLFKNIFIAGYVTIVAMFGIAAFGLVAFAGIELWSAFDPTAGHALAMRVNTVLRSIATLTVALAAFELADTVIEEEFRRETPVGGVTHASRVLSRFLLVVIVALSVESLVAVFQFMHDDPTMLVYAASIAIGAATLLASWGYFHRSSRNSTRQP